MAVVSRDSSLSNGFDSRPLPLQGWEAKNFVRYRWWNPSKEVSFGSGSSQGAQTTVRDSHNDRQDQHDQCACQGCPRELFTVDNVYNDLRMHCGGRRSQDSVAANVRQGSF